MYHCWRFQRPVGARLPVGRRRQGTNRLTARLADCLASSFHRCNLSAPAVRDLSPRDIRGHAYQHSRRPRNAFKLGVLCLRAAEAFDVRLTRQK